MAGIAACVVVGHGVAGHHLLPATVPNGIFLEGIILGALNGLLAVGLVLIYRTNRIINFAQGELGAFAATLAEELHVRFRWPFLPAVAIAIVAAIFTSAFIESPKLPPRFLFHRKIHAASMGARSIAAGQTIGAAPARHRHRRGLTFCSRNVL